MGIEVTDLCRYNSKCGLYDSNSVVCNQEGGYGCGRAKRIAEQESGVVKKFFRGLVSLDFLVCDTH